MFDPDGYQPISVIVAWIATIGKQGKLPRQFGFVHPGNPPAFDDLPAETVARNVIGAQLAAGKLMAAGIVEPSGLQIEIPPRYWRTASAADTMRDARLNLNELGLDNALHVVRVILSVDKTASALGFKMLASNAGSGGQQHPSSAGAAVSHPAEHKQDAAEQSIAPLNSGRKSQLKRGLSYRTVDQPLIDEMHKRIVAGEDQNPTNAAKAVAHKAKGAGTAESKVQRLAAGYRRLHSATASELE
jgi:hypothetical protein